jgi:Domain of unknown function (DUF3846)
MDALVVPADPKEPVRVIDLHAGGDEVRNLQREVGGVFDIVGHRECDLVINDTGRIDGSPVNVRISHWVLHDSALAKDGRAWEGAVIYGDVVITGPPRGGEATDVHPALVNYFSSLELSPNAVADWDTRDVNWRASGSWTVTTTTGWGSDRALSVNAGRADNATQLGSSLLRAKTGSCSRATKEAHLMVAHQSAMNTAHCSLKITERCTMKLTVVAIPWAMTNEMI